MPNYRVEHMKKVAVLVGGQYRHFDIAVKSWKPLIDYECDFYFSTWDTTQLKTNLHPDYSEDRIIVTENMITDYIPNAKVKISIESQELPEIKGNGLKMLAHWKKLMDMVRGKDYDILIVTRPDVFFNPEIAFGFFFDTQALNKDALYGKTFIPLESNDRYENHLFDDVFFMGYSNTVERFVDSIEIEDPDATASHIYLKTLCHSLSLSVISFPTGEPIRNEEMYAIVRPTVLSVDEKYYNYSNIKVCQRYFGINHNI
jgi:hypothetical protein